MPGRNAARVTIGSESGQGMIVGVAFMVSAIMLTALVADVGFTLISQRQIQNAADAASLAGARRLPENPAAAQQDARDYARRNGLSDDEIGSITISTTHYPNDTIRVQVNRDVSFMLATVMDVAGTGVSTVAVARTGSAVGAGALAPLAVTESVFAGLNPGDPAVLKYNATNASTGNFLPLALDKPGASEYGANLTLGSEQWLCAVGFEQPGCPSTQETEPGNVIGATRHSLSWIMANTDSSCDTFNEVFSSIDPTTGFAQLNAGCNRFTSPSAKSYRLVLVPIIKNLCNGSCKVTVVQFAMFFIESYSCSGAGAGNSCDLTGRYAKANADMQGLIGAYDPDGTTRFVRLVE